MNSSAEKIVANAFAEAWGEHPDATIVDARIALNALADAGWILECNCFLLKPKDAATCDHQDDF